MPRWIRDYEQDAMPWLDGQPGTYTGSDGVKGLQTLHFECAARGRRKCLRWGFPVACIVCIVIHFVAIFEFPQVVIFLNVSAPDGALGGILPPGYELFESAGDVFYWPNLRDSIGGGAIASSVLSGAASGVWPPRIKVIKLLPEP